MMIRIFIAAVLAGLTFLSVPYSQACPVPVYRYALEFWEADPYSIEIFYEHSFSKEESDLLQFLHHASADPSRKANIEIRAVNTAGDIDEITRGYIKSLSPAKYPWMVVKYPRVSGMNNAIWSGPLSREAVRSLISSPLRETLAGRLSAGVTSLWILLESGDRQTDRDAYNMLSRELEKLEQTLVLPDLELWWEGASDGSEGENKPVIKFEILRLNRADPDEEYLVRMLLNSEEDLSVFDSEPIVFPVYGRGIALYAIVGKGINQWNIREAAEFVTGPCSCQAKLLNPGVDLLVAMNWDMHVDNIADINLSNPLSGMGDFAAREAEVKSLLESATQERLASAPPIPGGPRAESGTGQAGGQPGRARLHGSETDPVVREHGQAETQAGESEPLLSKDEVIQNAPALQQQTRALQQQTPALQKQNRGIAGNEGPGFSITGILAAIVGGFVLIVILGSIIIYRRH